MSSTDDDRAATILVVEDDDDNRETLSEILESAGYRVLAAADGAQALARLQDGDRVDLVLLDLVMPVMTGGELYDRMQADPALARIPVIVSSSDPSRAPPGVPIMRKPVQYQRLLSMLRAALAA
jgi:CheY-like chemotaxis protein